MRFPTRPAGPGVLLCLRRTAMTNHPLNSIRYADLAEVLRRTLSKVNEYLDLAIELKKMELEAKKAKDKD